MRDEGRPAFVSSLIPNPSSLPPSSLLPEIRGAAPGEVDPLHKGSLLMAAPVKVSPGSQLPFAWVPSQSLTAGICKRGEW